MSVKIRFFFIVIVSLMSFKLWKRLHAPLALFDHDFVKREEEERSGSFSRSIFEYIMPPILKFEV